MSQDEPLVRDCCRCGFTGDVEAFKTLAEQILKCPKCGSTHGNTRIKPEKEYVAGSRHNHPAK